MASAHRRGENSESPLGIPFEGISARRTIPQSPRRLSLSRILPSEFRWRTKHAVITAFEYGIERIEDNS